MVQGIVSVLETPGIHWYALMQETGKERTTKKNNVFTYHYIENELVV